MEENVGEGMNGDREERKLRTTEKEAIEMKGLIQIQRKGCTSILLPNLVDGGTVAPAYTTSDSGSTLANHHVMFKSNHASVSGLALSMKAVRFSCGLFHTYGYTCL